MKKLLFSLLIFVLPAGVAAAQTILAASAAPTPSAQRVEQAEARLRAEPKKSSAYNDLALAEVRRARDTADASYLARAAQTLDKGFALAPGDYQLQKTQVALLLAEHKYVEAREQAKTLNARMPDDVTTYGYVAEADIALGNYDEAEKSVQWMLNLLPFNVPALILTAELRNTYGDPQGALEALGRAYQETVPGETEELAWIANRIAAIQIESGKAGNAGNALQQAELLVPGYVYTMENTARMKAAQGDAAGARTILLNEEQRSPSIHLLYLLARTSDAAGDKAGATAAYAEFESQAKTQESNPANANRELILYYADGGRDPQQALALAEREIAVRHDVATLDAYAWALYANGKYAEADAQEQKALLVGARDAQIFDHAGHIALKLGKQSEATKNFAGSLEANPTSEYATDAQRSMGIPADHSPAASVVAVPAAVDPSKSELAKPSTNGDADAAPVELTMAEHGFEPVPDALLIPKATETDQTIANAQARVARNSKVSVGYARLGAAFFQRARETGNVDDFQMAEQALTRSLDLVSDDLGATAPLESMAEVCMGEHRFSDALDYSQRALAVGSGDVSPFAVVGDAYADMGEYTQAGDAYGRLVSADNSQQQPATIYIRESRVAYLKFIHGDTDAAIRTMRRAVAAGIAAQLPRENLAWLYYELGEFNFLAGRAQEADAAYFTALTIHPGDYRALAGLGKVRANEGRLQEAIPLYEHAIAVVPMPIFIAELGDLYAKTGNAEAAKKQYQLVEYIGLLGHINQVLHNRDLALFYADHDMKLGDSLELAHKEFEVRHDIYTWDALAWSLYKNGKLEEAHTAMQSALHFGTRDPLLLFHAAMISARMGDRSAAQARLEQALQINPHFNVVYADEARQELANLKLPAQTAAENKVADSVVGDIGSDQHAK